MKARFLRERFLSIFQTCLPPVFRDEIRHTEHIAGSFLEFDSKDCPSSRVYPSGMSSGSALPIRRDVLILELRPITRRVMIQLRSCERFATFLTVVSSSRNRDWFKATDVVT